MGGGKGPFWDAIEGRAPVPPAARLLGWELVAVDPEAGTIEVAFEAGEEFLNPAGDVQGGILAAMLDDTLGGRVTKRGRTIAYMAGELVAGDGTLLATAVATANVRGG